jgi:hypothetical protein
VDGGLDKTVFSGELFDRADGEWFAGASGGGSRS